MSKSSTTENDMLKCVLQGTDPSWRAGATLYLALYTDDPGDAGTAITNETAYTNYARQAITKATGWTDNGSSFANAALIQFPVCGASAGNPLSHCAIVTTASGAGQILYSGELNDELAVATLVQPQFAIGALTVTED
jgi:hypothetical protein